VSTIPGDVGVEVFARSGEMRMLEELVREEMSIFNEMMKNER
jgi:hypothetical protein